MYILVKYNNNMIHALIFICIHAIKWRSFHFEKHVLGQWNIKSSFQLLMCINKFNEINIIIHKKNQPRIINPLQIIYDPLSKWFGTPGTTSLVIWYPRYQITSSEAHVTVISFLPSSLPSDNDSLWHGLHYYVASDISAIKINTATPALATWMHDAKSSTSKQSLVLLYATW